MRLQKFLMLAFMCCFVVAAPTEESSTDFSTTYSIDTTTNLPETTSNLPDSTVTTLDPRQNEVDAKLASEATTPFEIDEKIDSTDDVERSTERQMLEDNPSTTERLSGLLSDELNESSTSENEMSTTENLAIVEQTSALVKTTRVAEEAEETREPSNNNEFERFATEAEEASTTTVMTTTTSEKIVSEEPTTEKTASEVFAQQKSADGEIKDEIRTDGPELSEQRKALVQIKKILQAHVLKALVTLLNEVKQRQQVQAHEQQTMESQVVEGSLHSSIGSDCACEENDEVSTSDDNKVIAFDKLQQRYVYMDKRDYELMLREQNRRSDGVSISSVSRLFRRCFREIGELNWTKLLWLFSSSSCLTLMINGAYLECFQLMQRELSNYLLFKPNNEKMFLLRIFSLKFLISVQF